MEQHIHVWLPMQPVQVNFTSCSLQWPESYTITVTQPGTNISNSFQLAEQAVMGKKNEYTLEKLDFRQKYQVSIKLEKSSSWSIAEIANFCKWHKVISPLSLSTVSVWILGAGNGLNSKLYTNMRVQCRQSTYQVLAIVFRIVPVNDVCKYTHTHTHTHTHQFRCLWICLLWCQLVWVIQICNHWLSSKSKFAFLYLPFYIVTVFNGQGL